MESSGTIFASGNKDGKILTKSWKKRVQINTGGLDQDQLLETVVPEAAI